MANKKSAEKRARQTETITQRNKGTKSLYKSAIKQVQTEVEKGDKDAAVAAYKVMSSKVDRAAKTGVIHKNSAATKKSRAARAISALA